MSADRFFFETKVGLALTILAGTILFVICLPFIIAGMAATIGYDLWHARQSPLTCGCLRCSQQRREGLR